MPTADIFRASASRERLTRAGVAGVTGSGDPGVSEALGLENRTATDFEAALNAYKNDPSATNSLILRRLASRLLGFGTESLDADAFLALVGGGGYTLPTPFVIHDFGTTTGWFPTNAGAITITAEGGNTLVFTDTGPAGAATATNHNVINGDPATWGVVALLSDLGGREAGTGAGRDPQLMLSGGVGVRIGAGGSGGSGGTFNSGAGVGDNISGAIENIGDFWSCGNVAAMTGLPAAGNIGIRTEAAAAPGGRSIRVKTMLGIAAGRPTFLIRIDDGLASVDPLLLNMLDYYGFKATWFVPWANIGVVGGRLILSQVQAIRDRGHSICLNLTEDDNVITGLANPAAVVTKLNEGRAWLAANGFAAEGGNHVVYSNGEFGVNPNPVQIASATGSAGTAIMTMTSTTGLVAGMRVVGVGIPNSPVTTIASVDSATQITLSQNLTVAHTGATGRFKASDVSSPFYSRLTQDALAAAGVKSGWTTLGTQVAFYSRYGVGNRGLVLPGNSSTSLVDGTIQGMVDSAIQRGGTVQQYFHGVSGTFDINTGVGTGASSGLTSGAGALAPGFAYLKAQRDAGLIDVMTVPAWWARDCATPAAPPGL
jgi:hypothetical protein